MVPPQPRSTLFPYTTLFRSLERALQAHLERARQGVLHRHRRRDRSEEHTSELQSRVDLVCRLLLEKKNSINGENTRTTPTRASAPSMPTQYLPSSQTEASPT